MDFVQISPTLCSVDLWRTGKGFSPHTGSAAVARGSAGADTHSIIDKQTIANVFFSSVPLSLVAGLHFHNKKVPALF